MKKILAIMVVASLVVLAGCSSKPKATNTKQPKTPVVEEESNIDENTDNMELPESEDVSLPVGGDAVPPVVEQPVAPVVEQPVPTVAEPAAPVVKRSAPPEDGRPIPPVAPAVDSGSEDLDSPDEGMDELGAD